MFKFLHEAYAELRKVEWPDRPKMISSAGAVLIFSVVVGTLLYFSDILSQRIVHLFL